MNHYLTETQKKLDRVSRRLTKVAEEHAKLERQRATELGFVPCGDCFNGYCSMNCTGVPLFMKVYV